MGRSRIGQERLGRNADRGRRSGSLEIVGLIDWADFDGHLVPTYVAPMGEQAWLPRALFKALLLAVSYDLSDVKLAEALDDRSSFRSGAVRPMG